jgi:hypothetical protein
MADLVQESVAGLNGYDPERERGSIGVVFPLLSVLMLLIAALALVVLMARALFVRVRSRDGVGSDASRASQFWWWVAIPATLFFWRLDHQLRAHRPGVNAPDIVGYRRRCRRRDGLIVALAAILLAARVQRATRWISGRRDDWIVRVDIAAVVGLAALATVIALQLDFDVVPDNFSVAVAAMVFPAAALAVLVIHLGLAAVRLSGRSGIILLLLLAAAYPLIQLANLDPRVVLTDSGFGTGVEITTWEGRGSAGIHASTPAAGADLRGHAPDPRRRCASSRWELLRRSAEIDTLLCTGDGTVLWNSAGRNGWPKPGENLASRFEPHGTEWTTRGRNRQSPTRTRLAGSGNGHAGDREASHRRRGRHRPAGTVATDRVA